MRRWYLTFLLVAGILVPLRATKYSGEFEELGASARAVGLGSAFVAVAADPSCIYYNPAGGARESQRQALLMHAENFGGLVKNDFLGLVLPSRTGSLGIALYHTGVPGIPVTSLPDSTLPPSDSNRPRSDREVSAADWVGYFNYGLKLRSGLFAGANFKLIYRTLGAGDGAGASCFGMGIDLGLLAQPVKSLTLGARLRNASTAPLFWSTGRRESVEPRAALGIAKDFALGAARLLVSLEETVSFEGLAGPTTVNLGALSLEENLGLEFALRDFLAVRLGSNGRHLTLGAGGRYRQFFLDYAWSAVGDLGSVQKVSGGVRF